MWPKLIRTGKQLFKHSKAKIPCLFLLLIIFILCGTQLRWRWNCGKAYERQRITPMSFNLPQSTLGDLGYFFTQDYLKKSGKNWILTWRLIHAEQKWKNFYNKQVKSRLSLQNQQLQFLSPEVIWSKFQANFDCPYSTENLGGDRVVCGFKELYVTPFLNKCKPEVNVEECNVLMVTGGTGSESGNFMGKWLVETPCRGFMIQYLGIKDELFKMMEDMRFAWIDVLILDYLGGNEFPFLIECLANFKEVLPVGQLIVDFVINGTKSSSLFYKVFESLERRGLRPFHMTLELMETPKQGFIVRYSFLNLRGKHRLLMGPGSR